MKYRAWDTGRKKWQYFTLLELIQGQATEIWTKLTHWCRWTGKQDKNGIDIYEGDILRWPTGLYNKIVWEENRSCFSAVKADGKGGRSGIVGNYMELIGNIYEHADLMKSDKASRKG